MYYVSGWPESYSLPHVDYTDILLITTNDTHTLHCILTPTTAYIYQSIAAQLHCIGAYVRDRQAVTDEGGNQYAVFQAAPNNHTLAIGTSHTVINIVTITIHTTDNAIDQFPGAQWHDRHTTAAPVFYRCTVDVIARVKLSNDNICCMCLHQHDSILLGTKAGYLQLVSFDGTPGLCVDAAACVQSGDIIARNAVVTDKPSVDQVSTSSQLNIVTFVLSTGAAMVCDSNVFVKNAAARFPGQTLVHAVPSASSAKHRRSESSQLHYNATCIAINDRHQLIAVGLQNSDIVLFRMHKDVHDIDVPPIVTFTPARIFSMSIWAFTARHIGSVSCLQFSPDNSVLAVGYTHRGMCVWTVTGTRVACTLPQLSNTQTQIDTLPSPQLQPNSPILARQNSLISNNKPAGETLPHGVKTLCWTACGYNLLCVANNSATPPQPLNNPPQPTHDGLVDLTSPPNLNGHATSQYMQHVITQQPEIIKLQFIKAVVTENASASETSMSVLLGEDRLMLWAGNTPHSDAEAAQSVVHDDVSTVADHMTPNGSNGQSDEVHSMRRRSSAADAPPHDHLMDSDADFDTVHIPSAYLTHSWPIQHVAVSASGNQIAVAGTRGFALYNKLTGKWRLFGNLNHEQSIHTAALAWYGEHVIVVASVNTDVVQSKKSGTNIVDDAHVELLFFSRTALDLDQLLHTHRLHHPQHDFQTIDICDNMLIVQISHGQLFMYTLDATYTDTASKETHAYSTADMLPAEAQLTVHLQLLYIVDMLHAIVDAAKPPTPSSKVTLSTRIHSLGIALMPLQTRLWTRSADALQTSVFDTSETTDSCPVALHIPATLSSNVNSPPDLIPIVSVVVLTCHQTLLVLDIRKNGGTSTPVATLRYIDSYVSQFWLHSITSHAQYTLMHTPQSDTVAQRTQQGQRLFTYGVKGLNVWFRPYGSKQQPFASVHLSDHDVEVAPTVIDSKVGVIVGLSKAMRANPAAHSGFAVDGTLIVRSYSQSGISPSHHTPTMETDTTGTQLAFYRVQSKLQPYLHAVLQYLVVSDDKQRQHYAYEVAMSCRSHQYFTVALELLLHTTLNAAEKTPDTSESQSMKHVCGFLTRFAEYPDIIVAVARKSDSSCWNRLFAHTFTPVTLFKGCVTARKYRTASKYLVVIQRVNGVEMAHECARSLLQAMQTTPPVTEWKCEWAAPANVGFSVTDTQFEYDSKAPYWQPCEWNTEHFDYISSTAPQTAHAQYFKQRQQQRRHEMHQSELTSEIARFLALTAPHQSVHSNGFSTHKVSRDVSKPPKLTHQHPNGVLSLPTSSSGTPLLHSVLDGVNVDSISPINKQQTQQQQQQQESSDCVIQ